MPDERLKKLEEKTERYGEHIIDTRATIRGISEALQRMEKHLSELVKEIPNKYVSVKVFKHIVEDSTKEYLRLERSISQQNEKIKKIKEKQDGVKDKLLWSVMSIVSAVIIAFITTKLI